ncbi:MAG: Ig-like domain-containing protein, partial [Clostridia bacterium]|nr:Ig-like domain-containing protein [Clostridia bacterium]
KLTFTTEPAIADKTVTWKSSAGSIASINKDGVITLKKQGTVTFTAPPKKNKVAAASVTIFVKDNTIPTSLTITPAGPTTLEKGKTLQLTVKADTPEADATVTWKSSNSVVKVNKDGLVTADKKKTGTATITATSKKDKTVTQTITITVQ